MVPARMAARRAECTIVAVVMVMTAARPMLMLVFRCVAGRFGRGLFMTLHESRDHRETLQGQHEQGHQQDQFSGKCVHQKKGKRFRSAIIHNRSLVSNRPRLRPSVPQRFGYVARATIETLAEIKNPRAVAFVTQGRHRAWAAAGEHWRCCPGQ